MRPPVSTEEQRREAQRLFAKAMAAPPAVAWRRSRPKIGPATRRLLGILALAAAVATGYLMRMTAG